MEHRIVEVETEQPVKIDGVTYYRELGKISRTALGLEDHGLFTFMLSFNFNSTAQGFGGYRLDKHNKETNKSDGTAFGADVILGLINFFGVNSWEQIQGMEAYVLRKGNGLNESICGLQGKYDRYKIFLMKEYIEKWNL